MIAKKALVGVVLVLMSLVSFVSCEKDSGSVSKSKSKELEIGAIVGCWLVEDLEKYDDYWMYVFYEDGRVAIINTEDLYKCDSGISGGNFYDDVYANAMYKGSWGYINGLVRVDVYDVLNDEGPFHFSVTYITSDSITMTWDGATMEGYRYNRGVER